MQFLNDKSLLNLQNVEKVDYGTQNAQFCHNDDGEQEIAEKKFDGGLHIDQIIS